MTSEFLLIFLVALIVFGPSKLPMLAHHLGKLMRRFEYYKQKFNVFWEEQVNEHQLQENIKKAHKADKTYHDKEPEP